MAPREPGGECAERIAQPVSGMSTIAAYRTKWTKCAAWRSQAFMPGGCGGGSLSSLQATRTMVRASTVIPEDACSIRATILIGSGQLIEYDITYPPTTTGTGVTMIDGGTVGCYFGEYDPIPTTAQLIDLYSSENIVETGAYGISFSEINNADVCV